MRASTTVILLSPDGVATTVREGDEFPEWASVNNPDVIAGEPERAPKPESDEEPAVKPATRPARKTRTNN